MQIFEIWRCNMKKNRTDSFCQKFRQIMLSLKKLAFEALSSKPVMIGIAVVLVTNHDAAFPAAIFPLSYHAITGRSAFCHVVFTSWVGIILGRVRYPRLGPALSGRPVLLPLWRRSRLVPRPVPCGCRRRDGSRRRSCGG